MKPGPQTFSGTYGAFIVKDPNEATLEADGKIPPAANTHTLVLSDTEFDSNGDLGFMGVDIDLDIPPRGQTLPIRWFLFPGQCLGKPAGMETTWLVTKSTWTATRYWSMAKILALAPTRLKAKSGTGIRLRLINTATNRYFRLSVSNNGLDNNLYRIGGEGGFPRKSEARRRRNHGWRGHRLGYEIRYGRDRIRRIGKS